MVRRAVKLVVCVAVAGLMAFSSSALAQKVELPEAAQAAIKAEFPDATVGRVKARKLGEGQVFDVSLTEAGKKTSAGMMTVTEAGVVVSVAKPVAVDAVPAAVLDVVNKTAEGAKITSATRTESRLDPKMAPREKPQVIFAVNVAKDGQTGVVRVTEDGKPAGKFAWQAPKPKPEAKPKPAPAEGDE